MKTIIIGGVAAGTSVAAKLRRNDEISEIVIYEKSNFISYSTCGMPYFIGREDICAEDLTPRDPAWFAKRFQIDIKIGHEVLKISRELKSIEVKNLDTGKIFTDNYDELVIATGSCAVIPPIVGVDSQHVFTLKTMEDTLKIDKYLSENTVSSALVIGAGFIGMEIFENLTKRGLQVHLIEAKDNLLPLLDEDMSLWIQDYFQTKDLNYSLDEIVKKIESDQVITESGKSFPAELVILAAGVKPEVSLAKNAGIKIGETGAIKVDESLDTSVAHIKAVGDCAQVWSVSSGDSIYRPMGSTANKMGRISGDRLSGGDLKFKGVLGTGIVQFFDLQIGITGMTQREAESKSYDVEIIHNIKENQSKYLSESREMIIKAIADKNTAKLLGVQIIGEKGVDKRLDVFATAISFGATVDDLFHLDLSYAPPFSTTKDPVLYTGMILSNAIHRNRKIITPGQLLGRENNYQIIDVRSPKDYKKGHIISAENIPLAQLRDRIEELDKNKATITHCNKGVTGNAAQNVLINNGFKEVYNISGGFKNYALYKKYRGS